MSNHHEATAVSQSRIVQHGDSAAVLLPAAALESLGLRLGEAVELTVSGQQVIIQSTAAGDKKPRLRAIISRLLVERRDAYDRLA